VSGVQYDRALASTTPAGSATPEQRSLAQPLLAQGLVALGADPAGPHDVGSGGPRRRSETGLASERDESRRSHPLRFAAVVNLRASAPGFQD